MKTTIRALALVLLVCGGGAPTADVRAGPDAGRARARRPARPLGPPHTVAASTIRVHDGDTFYTGVEKIRLRGIDTPELGRPGARAAAIRLAELLREGPVTIVPRAEDVYVRTAGALPRERVGVNTVRARAPPAQPFLGEARRGPSRPPPMI